MSMTVKQAGRKGGKAVVKKHGTAHFKKIGVIGQAALRAKYPGMAQIWGKMAKHRTRPTLAQIIEGEKVDKKETKEGADPPASTTFSPTPPSQQ